MSPRTVMLIVAAVGIWGFTWVAMRAGLRSLSPVALAAGRIELAALVLVSIGLVRRAPLPSPADLLRLVLAGLAGFTVYGLLTCYGQRTVGAGTAAVIIQTAPMWTTLGASLLWGERVGVRAWTGMAVSLAGVALIAWGEGGVTGLALSTDVVLLFAASLLFAGYNLLLRPVAQRLGAFTATAWAVVAGAVGFLPWAMTAASETAAAAPATWLLIGGLAFVGILGGYGAWAAILARLPTARASSFLYLVPVVAMAGGWLILAEKPTPAGAIGAVAILAGVIWGQRR